MDQNTQQFYSQIIKPIIFLFTQKSNPNHRVYRFQLILMKFPNLHIVWTAGTLPDTLSRNTPPELLTLKTTVEIPKKKVLSRKR